ncbi:uncharacterized protein LOC119079869 isoform X3 [Bradysia coprophila]|uniref:uncharacterized protein LOC119079869 isoform X3 n=1 Tax=Bradysia coprophila TaxID=38358 RepID=UPI00187DC504|nr:uncharacterized protein LOC119079869 isoform X3 [Bradysia coprophila]
MELPNIETCNRRKAPLLDLTTEVIDNGDEKSDIDPENVKKISCDATPVNDEIIDGNNMDLIRVVEAAAIHQSDTLNCDKREQMDCGEQSTNESSKAFAFTIDFSEGKPVDSKKFNNIVERFQKRHRRGVSLDKIDSPTQPVASKAKPPLKKTEQKSLETEKGVKLRDKSQLSVGRESEMRHSWSPRTSLSASSKGDDTIAKFVPKSATLQLALKDVGAKEKFKIFDMTPTDEVIDDFVCPQPPLEFDKGNSDNESVSEAGTYTLDGDNYTEEQKAMMNIDKLPKLSTIVCQEQTATVIQSISHNSPIKSKPKHQDLEVIDLETEAVHINRNSVVQTSSALDGKRDKPKTSYLEKLKSKVRTIGDRAFHKNKSPDKVVPSDLDIGNFTSVTASGVFSKKSSLDSALPPRMARKNSLTKSHIDSSEYIQRAGQVSEKLLNSYTDYEKARHHEYQLNIFSQDCSTDIEKENGLGIKAAETKEDWIQEWAKNARRNAQHLNASRNERAQSEAYAKQNYQSDEFGDNLERNYSPKSHKNRFNRYNDVDSNYKMYRPSSPKFSPKYLSRNDESPNYDDSEFIEPTPAPMTRSFSERKDNYNIQPFARPPISPTKIPSPMHSMTRPRSSSVSRSVHSSITDLDRSDTEMYLQKTAAAISTLQNIHRNSPQSPLSPSRPKLPSNFTSSPSIRRNQQRKAVPPTANDILYGSSQSLHKRNLSLDGSEYKPKYQLRDRMSSSYNDEGLNTILNLKQNHTRHNSYEDKTNQRTIDQTFAPQIAMRNHISSTTNKQQVVATKADTSARTPTSQIKRSSSFSTKQLVRPSSGVKTLTPKLAPKTSISSLQKSASSNSFKNMASKYEDNLNNEFYLNDEDDLDPNIYSSDSELSDMDNEKELITNTRYNKAFLIRLEQNKQKASAVQKQGSLACPNTPEMPRRGDIRARTSLRDRQSMPRDSSISRMKQEIPALSATKKALTTKDKEPGKKVVPKYLDISKYKPSQGNTFLKRDESKSTLVNKEIKRSASAFLNKSDVGRSSIRSVKSAVSTTNKQAAIQNAKEIELAMWRKRASYDPMKAAAEGKKKQELARRSSQQSKYCDNRFS